MADTTTTIGRSKLTFPDLGYSGGATLEGFVKGCFSNLSDDLNSRYQEYSAIGNSTKVELDHNFGVAFEELSISIFTGSGTNLTKVSSPLANGWTLNAKSGSEKTILEITTPSSGSPHTFAVQCVVGGSGSGGLQITEIDHTFASDLETGKHYIVDLSGLTTADLSLNLPAGLAGSQIKVSVVGIELQTNYLTTPYYLKLIPDGTEKIYYDGTQYDDILVGKVSPWIQINWESTFDWVAEDPSNFTSRNLSGNWTIDGIVGNTDGVVIPSGNIGETIVVNAASATATGIGGVGTICSYSLPKGKWRCDAFESIAHDVRPSSGAVSGGVDLYDGSSVIADGKKLLLQNSSTADSDTLSGQGNVTSIINFTGSNKTISFRVRCDDLAGGSGSPTVISRGIGKMIFQRIG